MQALLNSLKGMPSLLLDALMLPQCLICNAVVEAPGNLFAACFSEVNFVTPPICQSCGVPLDATISDDLLCGECVREHPVFTRARAVFLYESKSRSLVLKLKHGDRTDAAAHLAKWLKRSGTALLETCDVIVPVPLHKWRMFMRTYNQSALLANALGKLAGVSVEANALVRKKATQSQGGLGRAAQRQNVAKAFDVRAPGRFDGKRVLLIDDVLTTGATANACASTLLRAGAANVDLLVLARVPLLTAGY